MIKQFRPFYFVRDKTLKYEIVGGLVDKGESLINALKREIKEEIGVKTKKIVVATNGFYQEGLVPQMNSRILPVISNIIVTRKLTKTEIDYHNFKTFYEHMSQSGFEGFFLNKYQISFNLIGVLVSNVTFKLLKKSTKR